MTAARRRDLASVAAALALTLVLAGVVSYHASGAPDGLERVAEDHGFDGAAAEHPLAASPVADYAVRGVSDERAAVGLAGIGGALATLALVAGILVLLRRGRRARQAPQARQVTDGAP